MSDRQQSRVYRTQRILASAVIAALMFAPALAYDAVFGRLTAPWTQSIHTQVVLGLYVAWMMLLLFVVWPVVMARLSKKQQEMQGLVSDG